MRSLPSVLLFLLSIAQLAAQDAPPVRTFQPQRVQLGPVDTPITSVQQPHAGPGHLNLSTDPKVEAFMQSYTEHKQARKGFRVQIFLGDRKTAEDTKRAFLQKNPEIPAYLSWLAPNFRLRVGDLRTRLEAEHLLRDMKLLYPGSYIVPDEIEMPVLPNGR